MAASNFIPYDATKNNLMSGAFNFATGNYNLILATATYAPSVPTDSTYANVSADETSGTGYTTGGITLTSEAIFYAASSTTLPVITAGGSGYAVSATFNVTVSGGTGVAAVVSVTTNASGVVTTVNSIVTQGDYSVLPTNPVATTGGTGTGLTLTMTWGVVFNSASVAWTTATITAKYAVLVHRAGVSLTSTDLLVGYVDLNSGGGSVSSTAATFTVSPNANGWAILT